MELWASRGIVDRFLSEGPTVPNSHFALLDNRMDYGVLDTPFPFILILDQPQIEEILEAYALQAGVDIRRGHAFASLTQRPDSVAVQVVSPLGEYQLEAAYLVGSDGVRSPVREAAGIGFPGTKSVALSWMGDVHLDAPPDVTYFQKTGPAGSLLIVPLGPGRHRVGGYDVTMAGPVEGAPEPTAAELAAKVAAVAGTDFGLSESFWTSQSGTSTQLADSYRAGRVFLAGDAAHRSFPAGGRGLNTGIQDAANLGWKLAAVVQGRASGELLDSYHEERHPVGAALVSSTRAQVPLMTQFGEETTALRSVLNDVIAEVPEFGRRLAMMSSGLDVVYRPAAPGAHRLVGYRAPDLSFADGTTLFSLLSPSRHVLLDLTGGDSLLPLTGDAVVHSAKTVGTHAEWASVRAALIRPDGHVEWASDATDDDVVRADAEAALR
jgi:2-polyprenyl-6-methoxyphenol hydroxylase-like FAD-dependent oxidoreductase